MKELLEKARNALVGGNYRMAGKLYLRLTESAPDFVPGLLEGARAFSHLGEILVARGMLERVSGLVSGNAELEVHLASGYFKLGDYGRAREVLETAYVANPSANLALALAETCERIGALERGAEVLEGVELARAGLLRGVFKRRAGDYEGAQSDFEHLLVKGSEGFDSSMEYRVGMELARCYDKLGEYERAWETMTGAREVVRPQASDARRFDRSFQKRMEEGMKSYDGFEWTGGEADEVSPRLLAGHPRSGTSVCAVHLATELGARDIDEVGSFARVMDEMRLAGIPPCKVKAAKLERFRETYRERMKAFVPDLADEQLWVDKNPGMERYGAYWLTVFPASKIYLVRRHPLDTVVSCLFTYLPMNEFSFQFSDAERALESVHRSLSLQDRLIEVAGERVEVIEFENFLRARSGKVVDSGDKVLHSPNYGEALKPVHGDAVGRWERYRDFLPKGTLANF